jgi:sugar diacid utilization regulator
VLPEIAGGPRVLPEIAGGPRVGVGPAVTGSGAPDSWAGARVALRFAVAGGRAEDRVVSWSDLGALALFATYVPDEAIVALPDVRALEDLSRSPYGKETVEALEALCAAGSVRRAAAAVHLHHSSMAARMARAEAALGFSLAEPGGRLRAHLALRLLRLRGGVSEAGPGAAPPPARRRPVG